jgi:phosphoribosyl 1,2-cyclic phosphate phosphodiesterase
MKVTFLGTGAAEGIPSPFCDCTTCEHARRFGGVNIRKRQSIIINADLLIDMGPDVPAACGMYGISLNQLKYNLITHSHHDHFYWHNLAMRGKGYRKNSSHHPLQLVAPESVFRLYGKTNDEALDMTRRGIQLNETFELTPYTIKSLTASHHETSGDAMNYIIDDGSVKLLYACDTGLYEDAVWEEMKGHKLDAIIMDSTVTVTDHHKVHLNHWGFLKMLERMEEIGSKTPETRVYATHFSHQGGPSHDELAELYGKSGIQVAYDGLTIHI